MLTSVATEAELNDMTIKLYNNQIFLNETMFINMKCNHEIQLKLKTCFDDKSGSFRSDLNHILFSVSSPPVVYVILYFFLLLNVVVVII